jgi:hypothetical protein
LNIKPSRNKYYYFHQNHKLVSPVNSAETEEEKKQEQANNQVNYYQLTKNQEIRRKSQLIQEQKQTIQKQEQQIKSLKRNKNLLKQLLKQKEAERLAEISQYQAQLKEKARINELNELELEKKISPYNSIEKLYYRETKTQEQAKYL